MSTFEQVTELLAKMRHHESELFRLRGKLREFCDEGSIARVCGPVEMQDTSGLNKVRLWHADVDQ